MKIPLATVIVQILSIFVSTGEALGQLAEGRRGGQDLDAVVDSVNTAQLQQSTGYTGLQEAEDIIGRGKSTGGGGGAGSSGRRHHNSHGPRRQHDCNNNDIAECVELLEVLTNKDLGFAATVDELNNMCPVLLDGLQCIDNYTRRCLTQKHRDYFNKLYAGTIRVIKDLCNTRGRYQEEYIRHAPCMRQVNPKYNACSVTYHRKTVALNHMQDASVSLSEDEKNRNVIILCCSFQEYLQCSEQVVFETCGNETALFTKEFLDRMAGPIVQGQCSPILSMYPCPQDLFPTGLEGLPSPSFTTGPSLPPAPLPTPTTRMSNCTKTSDHEAATRGHPQDSITDSIPTPSPQSHPSGTTVLSYRTTQRPIVPLPTTSLPEEAEKRVLDDSSSSGVSDVETDTSSGDLTSTVRLRVTQRQPELGLEAVSLHDLECVRTEDHQSSESTREHGDGDAAAESASLPSLLVASSLLKLVTLPPARWTEHDGTSVNGLTNPPLSSENFDANPSSALYSSDFNMSLAYSHPHSRRFRPLTGKALHRPSKRPRVGLKRTRGRTIRHGSTADSQRPVSIKGDSQILGLRPTRTPMHQGRIRHHRKHLGLPLRRRGVYRRRRPLVRPSALDTGQGVGTTNVSRLENRFKSPAQRRRLRGYLKLNVTTPSPNPDEKQETNPSVDTLEVTGAGDGMTGKSAIRGERLHPSRPVITSPGSAKESSLLVTSPRLGGEVGNGRIRYPAKSQTHPQRRHRKPGRRRKHFRGKAPHLPGKWKGVRRRPGWRRIKQPSGTGDGRPTSLTPSFPLSVISSKSDNVQNYDEPEEHSPVIDQNTGFEAEVVSGDMTLTTPLTSTTTDSETRVEKPIIQQPASISTPTSLTSVELFGPPMETPNEARTSFVDPKILKQDVPDFGTQIEGQVTSTSHEVITEVHDQLNETWTTESSVSSVLQLGYTQDPPDLSTKVEGWNPSTFLEVLSEKDDHADETQGLPDQPTQDLDTYNTTTEQASTTTIEMTRESLLPMMTAAVPTSSSNPNSDKTHFDDNMKADVQEIFPTDPTTGDYVSPNTNDLWFQDLILSEVREAVFLPPTPAPFTVRFWKEHDRKMDSTGFFSEFVPLTVDIVESDFVPLVPPAAAAAAATIRKSMSDIFEKENTDESDFEVTTIKDQEKDVHINEKTSLDNVPPYVQQQSSTTAAPESEDHSTSSEEPVTDSVPSQSGAAAGTALDLSDNMEDTRSMPTVVEIELHQTKTTDEEKGKEVEKKKTKKKRKHKKDEITAEPLDQSALDEKPNTSWSQLSVSTNDLIDHNSTSPAVDQSRINVSSPGRPINPQYTPTPTPPTSVSPSISGAPNPNLHPFWQQVGEENRGRVHPSQDTSFTTQSSLDDLVSNKKNRSNYQSFEKETSAPDRPSAADSAGNTLREEETSGASEPFLQAAAVVAVLLTVL